jgi:hypothetical protein
MIQATASLSGVILSEAKDRVGGTSEPLLKALKAKGVKLAWFNDRSGNILALISR